MARGGTRPKAGRPKGSKDKVSKALDAAISDVKAIVGDGQTPLAYLIEVMRDQKQDVEVRLDAAGKALPFVHKRQPQDINHTGLPPTPPPVVLIHTAPEVLVVSSG